LEIVVLFSVTAPSRLIELRSSMMQLGGLRDRRVAEELEDKSEGGSLSESYDHELSQISAHGERASSQRVLESFVPIPLAIRLNYIPMKLIS
jgi:hypothetical protein